MPLYEYVCRSCSRTFEAYKRRSEEMDNEEVCPSCGGRAATQGISLISAGPSGSSGGGTVPSCGGGGRRSPFS